MTAYHTEFGTHVNRNRYVLPVSVAPMVAGVRPFDEQERLVDAERTARDTLRDNVIRLRVTAGFESENALARACGWKSATMINRIKAGNNVGINAIARIAKRLKVQPWQLLVPKVDPANLPELLTEEEWNMLVLFRGKRR